MSLGVSSGDLIGSWSLSFSDIAFVTGKAETARLGLAVQLRFFAGHGFFVPDHASIPSDGVLYLARSEEHTSELQSLMRISYAVFCLKKKINKHIYMRINSKTYPR